MRGDAIPATLDSDTCGASVEPVQAAFTSRELLLVLREGERETERDRQRVTQTHSLSLSREVLGAALGLQNGPGESPNQFWEFYAPGVQDL